MTHVSKTGIACLASWGAALLSFALAVGTGMAHADTPPAPANAAVPAVPTNAVQPEVWTLNFPEALARARAEHRPLLLAGGVTGCGGCLRMRKDMEDKVFQAWVKGTGIYLARFFVDKASSSPEQAAAWQFFQDSKQLSELEKPFVGIYWPRATGDEVRVGCSYHHGKMSGDRHPSLLAEYLQVVDRELADYFKAGPKRPTVEEFLVASAKKIQVAHEGEGTVSVRPEDGLLYSGKNVQIQATPAPGWVFSGWKKPDGTPVNRRNKKSVTLHFQMDEGTYTAVFVKR